MFAGRVPVSWLYESPNMLIDDKLQREEGTIPVSLLTPTTKTDKLYKQPMLSGIFPYKLLEATEKCMSNERFPKEGEIRPVNVFSGTQK